MNVDFLQKLYIIESRKEGEVAIMLIQFNFKNFKSFRNLVEFKMTPAQKIKDLEYSLLKEKANNKEEKALSSSVIYGPNSSGKTNLIGGLQVFKAIVLRGNIKDADDLTSINIATEKLDFIPHIDSKENEPTYFYIKFLTNNMIIEYSITFLTEKLLSKEKDKRKILEEKLKIDGNNIYIRNEKIQIENLEYLKEKELLIENFHEEVAKDIINSNIEPQELLLNVMFKTLYSKKIYEIITNWFQDKLRIIYHADKIHYAPNLESRIDIKNSNKKLFSNPQINEAVKEIGLTSEKIAYPITDKKDLIFPVSVIKTIDEKGIVVPAEFFESFGTLRLLDIFPLMMATMKRGATLLVDELDASLHPMIIMSFIKIFHMFTKYWFLNKHRIKFFQFFCQDLCHWFMYSSMKVNGNAKIFSAFFSNCRNTLQYLIDFFITVYHLQFLCCIHFNCTKSCFLFFFCRISYICRSVTSNPGIHFHFFMASSSQQFINWRIVILPLNIPQCLIYPCYCTHQHTAATVKSRPVQYIPDIFYIPGFCANQIVFHFFYTGKYCMCMSLQNSFAPAAAAILCNNLHKSPSWSDIICIYFFNLHM